MPQRSISTTSVCPPTNSRSAVSLDRDTLPLERDVRQSSAEKPDHRHRRLLRARRERPSCGRAAEQREERAALHLHSITLSARARNAGGTVKPSALAVLRLMTNSNMVGCSTGRSAGSAPFRILSTYTAALRYRSANLAEYDISPPSSANHRGTETAGT